MDEGLHRGFFLGECRVDPLKGQIETSEGSQHVQPKVMEVLLCLAASPGEVVTRDALIEEVWGGRLASDEALTRCVSELRHALDDHADQPKYIQTIPKRGYRLISAVRPVESQSTSAPAALSGLGAPLSWRRIGYGLGLAFAILCGALAYYFLNPPASSFAFAPRDWVLVSFQNRTDDPVFDALDEAFRIALEQSRYANLFPESQVRDSLRRMNKDADAPIDRATGIEVAKREGIRALVLGGIARIGDTFSITAEVVDPERDRSVFTESTVSPSLNEVLDGLQTVAARLRGQLGESLQSIEETAKPLAQVATPDLEALRAYSMAIEQRRRGRTQQAILLLERAIEIDPMFAAAYSKLGTIIYGIGSDNQQALEHWQKALRFTDRLTVRDRLYLEASIAWFSDPHEMIRRWGLLTSMYPDDAAGHHNLGMVYWYFHNDFEKAIESFHRATVIPNPWRAASYYYLAYCQLGVDDFEKSINNFLMAEELAGHPINFGYIDALIAKKDYSKAAERLNEAGDFQSHAQRLAYGKKLIAYYIDQGQLDEAFSAINEYKQVAREHGTEQMRLSLDLAELALAELTGQSERLKALMAALTERVLESSNEEREPSALPPVADLSILGAMNARHGSADRAEQLLQSAAEQEDYEKFPVWISAMETLAAEIALAYGQSAQAVERLRNARRSADSFQLREALARAYSMADEPQAAIEQLEWMLAHRGRVFAEYLPAFAGRELSILEWLKAHYRLGLLYERIGADEAARRMYVQVNEHWARPDTSIGWLRDVEEKLAGMAQATGD